MEYGELIRRSWSMVWRNRFLWVLGLFAASTVGSCSPTGAGGSCPVQYQMGPEDVEGFPSQIEGALRHFPFEQLANRDVVLTIAVAAALLGIVFLIVSLIAQGAMSEATTSLALGRGSSLGAAWRTGLRLFWRYLELWVVVIGVGLLVALAFALAIGALVVMASLAGDAGRTAFILQGG